ncbi:MAG: phosphatase PAP2 family protein [Pseudomonadota bacterium]
MQRSASTITIILVVSVAVFVGIALLVQMGLTRGFDEALMSALRNSADMNDPLGPRWFEETAGDITALGGYPILVLLTLGVLAVLWMKGKRAAVAVVLASTMLGSLLSTGLKLLFARPRPDLVDHMDQTFTSSFPSAHAMVSTIVWLTLATLATRFVTEPGLRRMLLAFAAIIVALIGISRVYLGVHWPTDVVAGWAAGLAWASACWLVVYRINRNTPRKVDLGHEAV